MNLKECTKLMKTQTIGVEVEMSCISRPDARDVVLNYFESKYEVDCDSWNEHDYYDSYYCTDHKGRKWRFMKDNSDSGRLGRITCEMVTPILKYDDISDLQEIIRCLRKNGAKSGADYNAGVHIHIGADFDEENGLNAKSVRNLVNLMKSHERILLKSIGVSDIRLDWCKCVNARFLRELNQYKPQTKDHLARLWYDTDDYSYNVRDHYDGSRYHMINLHALFTKGTIEFRLFEFKRGLHAGELKAWIQLCLALCQYAKLVRYSRNEPINMTNEKYAMKNWLVNMGFIGDEFKTARKVLTRRLNGDTAYRNGRPNTDSDDLLDTQSYEGLSY